MKSNPVSVRLPSSVVQKIDDYKKKRGYTSRGQALVDLSVRAEIKDEIEDFIKKETDIDSAMEKTGKTYTWHKIEDTQRKLGYQGDTSLGHTPVIWVEDLNDIEIEGPILDKMIPEFLEKYQKIIMPLIKMKHKQHKR